MVFDGFLTFAGWMEMFGGFQKSELGDNRMISAGGKHLCNLEMIQMGMDQYLFSYYF